MNKQKFNTRASSKMMKRVARRKARGEAPSPVRKSRRATAKAVADKSQPAWTEADIASLRAGIADGLSYRQVQRTRLPHRTRNSIIGKCFRLGIREAMTPEVHRQRSSQHNNAGKFAARMKRGLIRPPETAHVFDMTTKGEAMKTIMELRDGQHCKWPIGDPKSKAFGYCGEPQVPGEVYCCAHHKAAYEPVAPAKAKRLARVERIADLPVAA